MASLAELGARSVDEPRRDSAHPLTGSPAGEGAAEDAALLARVRAGDEAAFGTLFGHHWTAVYRLALRVVGTPQAAEDVAQEVFVQLYRRPPATATYLRAWLWRVAVNLGLNALRTQQRRMRREERQLAAAPHRKDETGADDVLRAVLAAEERDAVREVLLALPERQRLCLLLRYGGLSYTELAAALGVASGSVGTLLARAEAAFKQRYLERRGGM